MKCRIVLATMVALLSSLTLHAPSAIASAPAALSYQGFLTDSVGNPVTGTWTVTFELYAEPAGGDSLFMESLDVTTDKGLFSVYLGTPDNPLPVASFEGGQLFLGLTVETDDGPVALTPRQQVVSDPYALYAQDAAQLGGEDSSSYVLLQQLPDICITPEALPDLLVELGITGGGLDEAALAAWLLANSYVDEATLAVWMAENGYSDGPHFSGLYEDLIDVPDLAGFMTAEDVAEALSNLGAVLLADGSVNLEGDFDFAGFQALNLAVHNSLEPPEEPVAGQLWWDLNDALLRVYTGETWSGIGTGVAADISCPECVDADDVAFTFAAADQKGGAALNVNCFQCISETEVNFAWAKGVEPGGDAEHALTADTATNSLNADIAADVDCPGCVDLADVNPAVLVSDVVAFDDSVTKLGANTVQGAFEKLAAVGGSSAVEGNGTIVPYVEQWGLAAYGSATTYLHLMNPASPKVLMHLYADDSASFASSNNLVVAYAFAPNQYSAGAMGNQGETALQVGNPSTFNSGSHIMVHQSTGDDGITAGTWELNQVKSVNGSTLHLIKPLSNSYVTGGAAKAQVVLAASFGNVEIVNGGTLKPSHPLAADGSMGGIVYVRANKMTVKSGGRIDADGAGFHSAAAGQFVPGSSECGPGTIGESKQNCSGGAGGKWECGNAGGGGNKAAGENGSNHAGCDAQTEGGATKGDANLTTLHFGGAGGRQFDGGGTGGGIIVIGAQSFVVQDGGKVSADGSAATDRGSGGGAGGTVALFADFHQLDGDVTADGGKGAEVVQWKFIEPKALPTVNFNTYSHGGGYSSKNLEFWYPQWSGSTVYRFNLNYEQVGQFNVGNSSNKQLWSDPDGTFYTANWGQDRVRKWVEKGDSQLWEYYLGSTAGGVCTDESYVYAMRHSGATVWKLNKSNGQLIEQFDLPNIPSSLYGGLVCIPGRLYYADSGGNVIIYDANSHQQIGSFSVGDNIYSTAFDGSIIYTSPSSATVTRHRLVEGNIYEPAGSGGDGGEGWVVEKTPMSGIINESYPKGIEIWVDGAEVTPQVGDPNAKGIPSWDAATAKWGKDGLEAWSTGPLDLTSVANWTLGEHSLKVKETGGAGGDVKMFAYVIYPFTKSSAPVNDTCDQPVLLDLSDTVTVAGTTEDVMGKMKATDANTGPFCGGSGGADVTYAFVLDDWRSLSIAVTSAFVPRVYLRKDSCDDGQVVACGTNLIDTGVLEPGTYYLVVDSDGNMQKGNFTLTVVPSPPDAPANDSCAGPQQMIFQNNVAKASGMTLFSNDLYSAACGGDGAPENIFTFEVPAGTSKLDIDVSAGFDPTIYMVKGNCDGVLIACIPDKTYQMGWPGPGTYFLFLDGKTANDKGLYELTVTLTQ
jgi:hypothetical protein